MRKSAEIQPKSKIKELPQKVKEHWVRLLVLLGLIGGAAASPLFFSASSNVEVINGHPTTVPQPSPAGEAFDHVATPHATPERSGFSTDSELLPSPVPIPEPHAIPVQRTRTP